MWTSDRDDRKLENTVKQSWFKHLGELQESELKHMTWAKEKKELLLSGPKSSFQKKVNFAFHLEIKVPESGGRVERHRIQVQCEVSTVIDDLGGHVICWCWSTVFSEVYS